MQINSEWRIVEYYRPAWESVPVAWYWRLEKKAWYNVWKCYAVCATRNALIRHVKQRCGDVDPEIMKELSRLPTYLGDKHYAQKRR